MRIFPNMNKSSICPICGTNEDKPCVLIGIDGTQEGYIIEAKAYHVDCIELTEYKHQNKFVILQIFDKRTEDNKDFDDKSVPYRNVENTA